MQTIKIGKSTDYSNCLKYCVLALTQAWSHFLHWSMALSMMVCLKSAQTLTNHCFSSARSRIGFLLESCMVMETMLILQQPRELRAKRSKCVVMPRYHAVLHKHLRLSCYWSCLVYCDLLTYHVLSFVKQ